MPYKGTLKGLLSSYAHNMLIDGNCVLIYYGNEMNERVT